MNKHILLAEDDESLGAIFMQYLQLSNFQVTWVKDGSALLNEYKKEIHSLILSDVNMPGLNGFEAIQKIRKINPNVPFIFITARKQKADRIEGLKLGAVDYITKPFEIDELVLKIQNLIGEENGELFKSVMYKVSSTVLDTEKLLLEVNGKSRSITEKESCILKELMINKNKVVKKVDLLEKYWASSDYFTGRSLDVFMTKLRKYISTDTNISIKTVRGMGVFLEVKDESPS